MADITNGRAKKCKNSIGGLKAIYLAPFKKVLRSEIVYNKVELTVFPQTFIYKFALNAEPSYVQSQKDGEGGKSFDVSLSFTFNKLSKFDNMNFQKMLQKDYFIVLEDRNDNFFLSGFRNGLSADKLDSTTAGNYNISFSGQEEEVAPFCNELINVSLIVVDVENYIFQNDDNNIFQNDNNYIFN